MGKGIYMGQLEEESELKPYWDLRCEWGLEGVYGLSRTALPLDEIPFALLD